MNNGLILLILHHYVIRIHSSTSQSTRRLTNFCGRSTVATVVVLINIGSELLEDTSSSYLWWYALTHAPVLYYCTTSYTSAPTGAIAIQYHGKIELK